MDLLCIDLMKANPGKDEKEIIWMLGNNIIIYPYLKSNVQENLADSRCHHTQKQQMLCTDAFLQMHGTNVEMC